MTNLTRRSVLTALGGVGLGTVAGSRLVAGERPPFSRYTLAQSTEGTGSLRVAWYERYNGDPVEGSGGVDAGAADTLDPETPPAYVDETAGAVVSLDDVLPGDDGTLVVGLQAIEADLNVWVRPRITLDAENGQNEPELLAEGADTDDDGELDELTNVAYWLDNGVVFGSCDGQRGLFEPQLVTAAGTAAAGTFRDVTDEFGDGVRLPFDGGDGCPDALPAGGNRCVGFQWALPESTGNEIQSDVLSFDLEFAATACGDDANPFQEVEQ
ncbi:hypothetical protein B4589_005205 [Halolamina sp. CBA1230]|uniref:hypothetical protein n=1 Tax=Halolamina sp. CBA1230 TaxID=1853690 RepID=UPI0009A1CDA9|nr:hypothetical protein [Halolamina sp. CBA1230]QKY19805.1 hypothetical protein B4589_005205 [Halolamina sp. CBA1230]